jgi:beta-glucanase (GH16 family)
MLNNIPQRMQEIDIFENDSIRPTIFSSGIHDWTQKGQDFGRKFIDSEMDMSQGFNTVGCLVDDKRVSYFYNGTLINTVSTKKIPFSSHHIWLTSIANALGTMEDETLPSTFEVDYIRVFNKK